MKLKLIPLGLALGAATLAHAQFTPVPIDPASFNQDVVIEAPAPPPLSSAVTATMDGGTNKTGNTWYERGYNPAAPTTGLPAAGSLITSGAYVFQMPPDYHTNNVIMVGHANGLRTPVLEPATLTLTTPAAFTGLSFLTDSGNGPVTVGYTVHYADSFSESGTFTSTDWFNAAANVYNAAGRVHVVNGVVANVGASPAGALFAADIPLINPMANVTSVDFNFVGGSAGTTNSNGRAVIFAISGAKDSSTDYTNILAVTGFNHDAVVEADGPPATGTGVADANVLTNLCTVTMDGGTSKTNNCWFEQGFYRSLPNVGFPAAGSTIASAAIPATYTMPSSYATNNAVVLASNFPNATITLATPATYGALSFLCSAANNDTILPVVVTFQDGSSETNAILVPDWSNRAVPWAYRPFGRVNPYLRVVNQTPDQYVDPFALGIPGYDYRGVGLPWALLFDAVVPINNTASPVTSISLALTNGATSTRVTGIYAVSGAPAGKVPPVFGSRGTATPGQPANAAINAINLIKTWESTNNVVLSVTNIAGTSPISYQWKKAPRGGGLHDMTYSIDYNTFANVTDGGRISGATSSALVISNALSADSADYLVVASSAGGSITSLVATVMILTTNQSLLVGAPLGDVITLYSSDTFPTAESVDHAIDRVAQKWLSRGLQNNVVPFVGPVGYVVTPVSGASIVTSLRFYAANDTAGRDPFDYTLEGSNDGANWTPITGGALRGTLSLPSTRNSAFVGAAPLVPDSSTNYVTEVDFANTVGYKSYRVSITNIYDWRNIALMQIGEIEMLGTLVPNPPVFTRQPHSVTVFAGASPVFSAEAAGYPPPRFQWFKDGTQIAGATGSSYTFANAQISDTGSTFSCNAINAFGTVPSAPAILTVIAAPTQTYPVAVLANGPVGFWRLDEGPDNGTGNNGIVARDYTGGHNGTYSNAVLAVEGYNPVADSDTAVNFGTFATVNSYVDNILDVDFARAPNAASGGVFSIEAWAYGGDQSAGAAVVTKGYNGILAAGTGTGTEQFALDVATVAGSVKYRFLVRDAAGNGYVAQSSVTPYIGDILSAQPVWHHLVGVCDQPSGKVYLYVDGLLAASGNIGQNVGILAQPLPMTIGARKSGGATEYDNQWKGRIDDVAVYNTALSSDQVLSHFFGAQLPPVISLQPTPTNMTAPENISITFAAEAYGPGTLGFQWYLSDGLSPVSPLAGQTSSNLTFTTKSTDSGSYQLVVTNNYGAVTSAVAQLTVVSGLPSYIVDLPTSSTIGLGHIIQLQVYPGGTAPFTYQWKKDGVNLTDDYRTSGSQTNVLTIGYATNTDSGTYQVVVSNAQGSTPSATDAVTVSSSGPGSVAFNAAGTGWQMQGSTPPIMGDNRLELTSGLGNTARSAFLTSPIGVASFTASFVYQVTSGAGGADGVTFCIQNAGPTSVGTGGGGLGYGGITPSVALGLNIYANNTRGIQVLQNGNLPAAGAGAYFPIDPVLIGGNANPVQINISYAGGVLQAAFKDTVTQATYTTNVAVNIPGVVGSSMAYFGFTGADGGTASTQVITSFGMSPPPVRLGVQKVGDSMVLTWPAATGAFLRSTPSLTNPVWSYSTDLFRVVDGQVNVTVTPLNGNGFYRLDIYP
ncbi:MAG TPA: immunoglobulin domain-containing protein [Verrucomicrobiae bacterium]